MASFKTVFKTFLNVKNIVVEKFELKPGSTAPMELYVYLRHTKRFRFCCPCCGQKCSVYDGLSRHERVTTRALDLGSLPLFLVCHNPRIHCPVHGVKTAAVPWALPGSRFTKGFDLLAAYLASHVSKKVVSELLRIDWKTVGRCISRVKEFLEPDPTLRFQGLKNIGIDETSFSTGHRYITVVVDHDRNRVVWAHEGHDEKTLSLFFESLSEEQRSCIQAVSGDGARWIDKCIQKYIPHATRCLDNFHVVQWATDAMDSVRIGQWRQAQAVLKTLKKELDKQKQACEVSTRTELKKAEDAARKIKGCKLAIGKAAENLTLNQEKTLQIIETNNPKLHRAYSLKESLRLILKSDDPQDVALRLKRWRWMASHSRISEMVELSRKIKRHENNILNTVRLKLSNGRVEANNNKIQLVIRKAFGFKNLDNLINMVLLVCSDLKIPLLNRINSGSKPTCPGLSQLI